MIGQDYLVGVIGLDMWYIVIGQISGGCHRTRLVVHCGRTRLMVGVIRLDWWYIVVGVIGQDRWCILIGQDWWW